MCHVIEIFMLLFMIAFAVAAGVYLDFCLTHVCQ